jgi:hypothetical protein
MDNSLDHSSTFIPFILWSRLCFCFPLKFTFTGCSCITFSHTQVLATISISSGSSEFLSIKDIAVTSGKFVGKTEILKASKIL